jgi:hypothetical protein
VSSFVSTDGIVPLILFPDNAIISCL